MKSFRTRLVIWNATILLIVLVAFGWSAAVLTERAVLQGIDREIEQFLRRGPGGPPSGPERMPPMMAPRFGPDPNGPRTILPDGTGDELSAAGFDAARDSGFDLRTEVVEGRPIRVGSVRRDMPGGGWQVVQVGRDLTDAESTLAQQRTILFLLLPVGVVAAIVGGMAFVRRALKPVEDVTRAAREIGAEDLGRRLTVTGDDELAELAMTFNGMIERLQGSFIELQESNERQRRFVADASHELRTPLSQVKLVSSSALTQPTTESEKDDALRTIDMATNEMTKLVDGLLQLARADSGALQLGHEAIDLKAIVRDALANVPDARTRAITTGQVWAMGDSDATKRILTNFLSNARRYARSVIEVQTGEDQDRAWIAVRDDGEGLPPEQTARLKERFYRAGSSRARTDGGIGLGLAICDALATAMGGEVQIESEVGKGTRATLFLPKMTAKP